MVCGGRPYGELGLGYPSFLVWAGKIFFSLILDFGDGCPGRVSGQDEQEGRAWARARAREGSEARARARARARPRVWVCMTWFFSCVVVGKAGYP